jgi:hypothetical protein
MPNLYDILLSDIDDEILRNDISEALASPYLSETPHLSSPIPKVNGVVFGRLGRIFFPLVVAIRGSPSYIIHFIYDSGSPFTFLSRQVCGVLEPKHL